MLWCALDTKGDQEGILQNPCDDHNILQVWLNACILLFVEPLIEKMWTDEQEHLQPSCIDN